MEARTSAHETMPSAAGSAADRDAEFADFFTTAGPRRRRRGVAAVAAVVAAVVGVAVVVAVTPGGSRQTDGGQVLDPVGSLDLSGGLRAVASPGGEVHLGGRTFSVDELPAGLDTDAVVTDAGIVFYRDADPYLLDADGEFTRLEEARGGGADVRPTAKADGWLVAYGLPADGGLEVVVRDLASGDALARRVVGCAGDACGALVIDALDDGDVFVRTPDGTLVWEYESDTLETVATGDTRVADVRNGVLLYDGPRPPAGPVTERYRLVRGAIDAQLTLDGRYVVSWSSRLRPTAPGDPAVVLDQPRPGTGYAFWAVDTDGSVLVAVPDPREHSARVFDCQPADGSCVVVVDDLETASGDPLFIGVDM